MQGNGNSYPAPVFLENTRNLKYNTDRQILGVLLEIIDGRELPEYMTMNKGKICG